MYVCYFGPLILILAYAISVNFVASFNVDSVNYAAYNGPDFSMFGFSVAFHKTLTQSWLIVGAPEAQSGYQPGVFRGGVVYQCPTGTDGDCREIPFDTKGNNRFVSPQYTYDLDNKTGQWFGATVSSSGTVNGRIVACAPRYTWHPKNQSRRDPVGTCYVSDENLQEFNEYAPCRTFQWGYHRQGSCQAGLSAALNTKKNRLFVGAPGSTFWQGEMYSIDANERFNYSPVQFSDKYGAEGQILHQSLDRRPAVFSTAQRTEDDDNTYMGYSMTAGNFFNSTEDGIAVGIPRDNGLKGNVKIMRWNLTTEYERFSSDQVGSYFGYALAVSDVDGDGGVDLIVGAPMYTKPNNKDQYDVGRVYVYYQNSPQGRYVKVDTIDGFNTKSRFGQALASLGDINLDGYGDFAIGAPYDGPHNQGAVYIYHGSKTGIRNKYSQVIYAEDIIPIAAGGLATFGFSITGGLDLDQNNYPDMAVGAYLSNKAFFFRSRPVVWVDAFVNFLTQNKQVDIKQSNYILRTGGNAVRTQIDFCIKYSGQGIPPSIVVDLQYILDSKKQSEYRMGFIDHEKANILNETIQLRKDDNNKCITKDVYVLSDVRDKLTPLAAEVKYALREDARVSFGRNPSAPLKPILDLNSPPSRSDAINILKECGPDNICTPDLKLTVTPSVDKYMLDSEEFLFLDFLVSNVGEDSYDTILELHKPENVLYAATVDKKSSVNCNWKVPKNETTIRCEIGNPIPKDKIVNFKIKLQPKFIEDHVPSSYDFYVTVNSTNPELDYTLHDNARNVSVGIFTSSPLEVRGKSYPAEIFINASNTKANFENAIGRSESEIGPQIFHEYYLRNDGPTTIEEAEMIFIWPSKTKSGEDFVYLLEHFSSNPKVVCEPYPANYRGFQLEFNRKSIWEKLHLDIEDFHGGGKVQSVVGGGTAQSTDESINQIVASTGDGSQVHSQRHKQISSSGTVSANGDTSSTVSQTNQFTHSGRKHFWSSNATHFRNASGVYISSTGQMISRGSGEGNQAIWQSGSGQSSSEGSQTGGTTSSSSWQGGSSQSGGVTSGSWQGGSTQTGGSWQGGSSQSGATWQGGSSQSGGSSSWQGGSHHQGGGIYGGAVSKVNVTYTCKEEIDGVSYDVPCGSNGEFPAFNSSYYQSRFGGNLRPVSTSEHIVHECFQTINGVERKVDCRQLKGYNDTYFNQQQFIRGGSSGSSYQQGSQYNQQYGSSGSQYQNSFANANQAEYQARQEYQRKLEEQRKQEELRRQEEAKRAETRRIAEEHRLAEQRRIAEEARRLEAARRLEETRRLEEQRKLEETRRLEERRRQEAEYHRQEEERRRIDLERRRQDEIRRIELERQRSQQQYNSSQFSQSGSQYGGSQYSQSGGSQYSQSGGSQYSQSGGSQYSQSGHSNTQYGGQYSGTNSNEYEESYEDDNYDTNDYRANANSGRSRDQDTAIGAITGVNHGGNQFRVGTLDLGDLGGSRTSGSGAAHAQSSDGQTRKWSEEKHWSETHQIPPTYINNIERDNVPTDRPNNRNKFYGRKKRDIDTSVLQPCQSMQCFTVRCTIKKMNYKEDVTFVFRSRLNTNAVQDLTKSDSMKFSSLMQARISKLKYNAKPEDEIPYVREVFTTVSSSETKLKPDIVPLWVVVLSAVAGIIILLLIILCCSKLGFFNRNRREHTAETQPLQGNGYHDDAHL